MIRKHHSAHSLIVISLLLIILISGIASAEVGNWIVEGDKVYVDDNKVYLSASPHTIDGSGWVYFDINSKVYSGDVDLYFGFNSGGMKPTRAYANINDNWVEIASYFNKVYYDYDGFDTWYYSKNLPVNAGQTYKIAVWMEQPNEVSFGKYGFAIKPSSETISQAITNNHFYYLDPWWNSSWNSLSIVTLNTSVPVNNLQIHLSSDDFVIPLKMWMNMNQDGNDSRFLHSDNSTEFPIWIEHITARDDYSIWVNVTDNTTADKLNWYYGNSNASSVSNGHTTFPFFDDFNDGNYDGWTVISGSWDASNGYLQESTSAEHVYIQSPYTFSDSKIIEFSGQMGSVFHYSDADNHYYFTYDGKWYKKVTGYTLLNPYSTGLVTGQNTLKVVVDGADTTLKIGGESYTDSTYNSGYIGFDGYDTVTADNVRIRQYADIEPIISDINLTVIVNTAPTTPDIKYPANESIITAYGNDIVELNVTSIDLDNDSLIYYFYGDIVDGSTYLGQNDSINGSTFNWSITQYDTYYWKARAHDGFNYSEFTTIQQFTLIAPPALYNPTNGSTQYETYPPLTATVSFDWQDLATPQYRFILAEDVNFNVIAADTHVGTNNTIQSILVNKQYWWKVYSYDGTTYSDDHDVYSFNLTGNSSLIGSAIEGVVYQSNGDISAISGAEVTIWNTTWSSSMITGSNGYYVFEDLNSGTVYNLQAKSDRYWDSSIALVSAEASPVTNNFYLIDDLTDTEWWHYVEFTVQNVWGVTYPDVATNVYIEDSVTIYDSGNTESDGTISYHLDQNIQYRITFINSTLGINEDITLYPISESYTVYIDSYSFDLPDPVTDDVHAYIVSSRINATHGYINFTYSDTSDLTTSISYYISDVDGNFLYNTSTSNSDLFDSQVVTATDDRYIVRYVGVHPTHGIIDKTETVAFHGGRRVDFGWPHDWQYAVTALAFLIFIGSLFGARTAHYGSITVVIFAWIFKWIGWLDETNTSTLLIILAAVIAFGWSLRKSEEVKM